MSRNRHSSQFIATLAVLAAMLAGLVASTGNYLGAGYSTPVTPVADHPHTWPQAPPLGITLSGLQAYLLTPKLVSTMEHQVHAAALYWHANTIRFQVLQDKLVGVHGDHLNQAYLQAVREVTSYTLNLGLTVVLNAQTEQTTGYGADEGLPTHATRVFWDTLAGYYAGNSRVVFDLFNEPRRCDWAQWHAAFQRLVTHLRREGITNTFWVEGIAWASTLQGLPVLTGGGIVYSFHKPGAPWPYKAPVTRHVWDMAFGDFCDAGHACVDGEFGNYKGSYYWRHHPVRTVRKYLAYLHAHGIGMLAWSLIPGSLNSTASYRSVTHEPKGDGALVRQWFRSFPPVQGGPWARKTRLLSRRSQASRASRRARRRS